MACRMKISGSKMLWSTFLALILSCIEDVIVGDLDVSTADELSCDSITDPNPAIELMDPKSVTTVDGIEIPLPVFPPYDLSQYYIVAYGYEAAVRNGPVSPKLAHYKERHMAWQNYMKERCVLEPYFHGYVCTYHIHIKG